MFRTSTHISPLITHNHLLDNINVDSLDSVMANYDRWCWQHLVNISIDLIEVENETFPPTLLIIILTPPVSRMKIIIILLWWKWKLWCWAGEIELCHSSAPALQHVAADSSKSWNHQHWSRSSISAFLWWCWCVN